MSLKDVFKNCDFVLDTEPGMSFRQMFDILSAEQEKQKNWIGVKIVGFIFNGVDIRRYADEPYEILWEKYQKELGDGESHEPNDVKILRPRG